MDFYIRGLQLVRAEIERVRQGEYINDEGENSGTGPESVDAYANETTLFPVSSIDSNGHKIWDMPTAALVTVRPSIRGGEDCDSLLSARL